MFNKLSVAVTLLCAPAAVSANINIVFDYTYATGSFFGAAQKNLLEAAASMFEARISDQLGAITSGGGNHYNLLFTDPGGSGQITLHNQSIDADVLRIYVGATNLGSNVLGMAGPGGWSASGSQSFLNSLDRGQNGVASQTDFAPWGGSLSFNSAYANWYFDNDVSTLESFSGADFYSVALHEITHILGFGTANSWLRWVDTSSNTFNGPASGGQPLDADEAHWQAGLKSSIDGYGSFEAAMTPSILLGTRKPLTDLDWNALRDIGWQVTAVPETETWILLLSGLGCVGWMARRRTA